MKIKERTLKKWKKRGIVDKMTEKYLARKGLGANNKPTSAFGQSSNYLGEQPLIGAYRNLQSISPKNSLLECGVLDESNHLKITEKFYSEHFPGQKDVRTQTAVIRYLSLLKNEYKKNNEVSSPEVKRDFVSNLEKKLKPETPYITKMSML